MVEFTYTTVPGKIKQLLTKIRQTGVPDKVTVAWLKTVGFTSSNDSSLINILKFLAFVDTSGVPTQRWRDYRGSRFKEVLGEAAKSAYQPLFKVYPDAYQRSASDIENVFRSSSSAGNQVISKTLATFRAIIEEATFNSKPVTEEPVNEPDLEHEATTNRSGTRINYAKPHSASLHIDIQIHISPESSSEQIEQIFQSMAKHLYSGRA